MNYLVADFITRIKNAAMANRRETIAPYSKLNMAIGTVLQKKHFLSEVKEELIDGRKMLKIGIKYEHREPSVQGVLVISKPSLRVYKGMKDMKKSKHGSKHMVVISTSKGIMTEQDAKIQGIGGEILFEIW